MTDFTSEEKFFITDSIKRALAELHMVRQTLGKDQEKDGYLSVMSIENQIKEAESAWKKIKEFING